MGDIFTLSYTTGSFAFFPILRVYPHYTRHHALVSVTMPPCFLHTNYVRTLHTATGIIIYTQESFYTLVALQAERSS